MADTTTNKQLVHDDTSWSYKTKNQDGTYTAANVPLESQTKTFTFATAGKYVDKDIAFSVKAKDGSGSISGGGLTIDDISISAGSSYLTSTNTGLAITVGNKATRAAASYSVGTAGWVDAVGDVTGLSSTSASKSLTKYIIKGAASVSASQSIGVSGSIKHDGSGNLSISMSGSKSITGSVSTAGWITSVSAANVSASGSASAKASDLDSNLKAENILTGVKIFGVTGKLPEASFLNAVKTGESADDYTDISDAESTPVLISGDYLYITKGYVNGNKRISLAKLVPDKASLVTAGASNMRSGTTAYDNDGKLVSGTMPNAVITSGAATLKSSSVGALANSKYPLTVTVTAAAPTVGTTGYISSSEGTKNAKDSSVTVQLTPATCTVSGGGLTAGSGSSSINVNGYYDGTNVSSTDKVTLTTTAASGYYKIGTTGKGTVNRAAITDTHTAGWLPAKSASTISAATSLSSNSGTSTYYIKKSTLTKASADPTTPTQSITPSTSKQTYTISEGYYPSDRTVTVAAMTNGAISAADSTSITVTPKLGTAVEDVTNLKYNVPITVSASATAYAKVTTSGYVTNANNTSKALSGSGSATVSIAMYDGTFTIS